MNQFLDAYHQIHKKNRAARYDSNIEISNQAELCEILKQFNILFDTNSKPVIEAVKAYFSSWRVTATKNVEQVLQDLHVQCTTGLITNFTDTTFVYKCLNDFNLFNKLDSIIISAEIGWRKPNKKIFDEFLQSTKSKVQETLFVGDDINCDIAGAKNLGLTTALIHGNKDQIDLNNTKPDYIIGSVDELPEVIRLLKS
jgi:putative hydrolase of the HAD superfamily